jgi:hypothetical protein
LNIKPRSADARAEEVAKFCALLGSWPARIVAGLLAVLTLAGTLLDLWFHWDGVQALWRIYKAATG